MVLEIWYVCFDFMEKIAKQIEFALSCTYSVFTYFSGQLRLFYIKEKSLLPNPLRNPALENITQPTQRCLYKAQFEGTFCQQT